MDKEQTAAQQQEEVEVIEVKQEQPVKKEIIGEVVKVKGERAIVELFKENSKKKSNEVLDASNPISAKPGHIVKIAWRKVSKSRDNFMLFGPPILCFIAGAIFSYHLAGYFNLRKEVAVEDVMIIGVPVWLLLGLYFSFRYWRYTYGRGVQPTITDIIRK